MVRLEAHRMDAPRLQGIPLLLGIHLAQKKVSGMAKRELRAGERHSSGGKVSGLFWLSMVLGGIAAVVIGTDLLCRLIEKEPPKDENRESVTKEER